MSEIPESPLSRHDIDVLLNVLARQGMTEYQRAEERQDNELVIAAARVKSDVGADLRFCGVPVRLSEKLGLNEILFVRPGREPLVFDFESDARTQP